MKEWWCESEGATRRGKCVLFVGQAIGEGAHTECGWRQLIPDMPVYERAHLLREVIADSLEAHPLVTAYDLILDDGVVQAWVRAILGETE